jgi:hypothetical protein
MRLVSLDVNGASALPCPGGSATAPSGPGVETMVQGVVAKDVVAVLADLGRRGWRTTTHMTTSIELRPAQTTELNLGLVRFRLYRGIILAYTPDHQTRVISQSTLALCGP